MKSIAEKVEQFISHKIDNDQSVYGTKISIEGVRYEGFLKNGFLKIAIGGGTGFKIKVWTKANAKIKLQEFNKAISGHTDFLLIERLLIDYCQRNGWKNWNYVKEAHIK